MFLLLTHKKGGSLRKIIIWTYNTEKEVGREDGDRFFARDPNFSGGAN